ncbi:MAG: hypothetical protein MRJ66_07795 [Nitrospira sp.]|nr:hypothetical protein [Nitrospira sp.]
MPDGAQDFSVLMDDMKRTVREHIEGLYNARSFELKMYSYTRSLEEKMAKKIAISDVQWLLYGHVRFMFGEPSLDDLRAAARAYQQSSQSPRTRKLAARFLEEVIPRIRSIEDQSNWCVRLRATVQRVLFPNRF